MPAENENEAPTHCWNGSADGHNCRSCPPSSIWKCDKAAHLSDDVLPPLPPIPGLMIDDPYDLLTEDERDALKRELAEMAKHRRLASGRAGQIPLARVGEGLIQMGDVRFCAGCGQPTAPEPELDYRIGRHDETTRDWERRQSQYPTFLRRETSPRIGEG